MLAGMARNTYNVPAPATTGHPIFERYLRVQQNTLEQLIIFLPAMWMFAYYVGPRLAALLGLVFVIGRLVYFRGYVADPKQRSAGFAITMSAEGMLFLGAFLGALWSWI
jgi:uncharacterized MAPEG superfamily protein